MNTEVAARSMDFITPEQQDNSSSLLFAWRRKWILVILAGIGVALGYLYFLNQKPTYESMAQVLVIDQQPIQVQGMELAESYDNTHEVLIQSQAVAALAATELESKQNTQKYHWSEIMAGLSVTRASRDRASGDVYDVRFRSPSQSECEDVLR
ncbi:MAG: Wzz/FepE/Etk N-terminal domain-containing protein, partial [Pirellulaceae bacterium]